jgi:hypothetical protein
VSRPVRETAEAIEAARGKGILAVMARADASATIRSSSGGAMMQIGFVYLSFCRRSSRPRSAGVSPNNLDRAPSPAAR